MIETFAVKHKLRIKTDQCRDKYIPARLGQIFCDGDRLVVMFLDNAEGTRRNVMRSRIRKAIQLGLVPRQIGDGEGTFDFEPEQAKVVIKLVGARRSRKGQGAGRKPPTFAKTSVPAPPFSLESTRG